MFFPDAKTKGFKKEFKEIEQLMKKLGFTRWAWDYKKVTYDYKYTVDGVDYYLRLPCRVVNDKQLEHPKAIVETDIPVFARHFFPHGLDNDAAIPEKIQSDVIEKISEVEKNLSA
ncbi:YugN family protein [Shimazuella alba]|uniref:YugN-like family protein n=1 Tax=Shimazuella alba TaxID=2690964 RepID=A0A6I4VRU7_9BACL|nr:YugN family protein [Shimazuella alba]MXQ54439.1 hypothetical protein [Shimazuella alba]